MKHFISVWTTDATAYLNTDEIARISFAKKEDLKSSEREVKVQFRDGSTGTYVGHRNTEKLFADSTKVCACEASTEA